MPMFVGAEHPSADMSIDKARNDATLCMSAEGSALRGAQVYLI